MLSATEFTIGNLTSAKPLSLVLPRREHEEAFLIGASGEEAVAVFLTGAHAYMCFKANSHWSGLIIPDVRVEADESTVFDPQSTQVRGGQLIRVGTGLFIAARREAHLPITRIAIETNLPTVEMSAGFTGWRLVIGQSSDKRVVWKVTPNAA